MAIACEIMLTSKERRSFAALGTEKSASAPDDGTDQLNFPFLVEGAPPVPVRGVVSPSPLTSAALMAGLALPI